MQIERPKYLLFVDSVQIKSKTYALTMKCRTNEVTYFWIDNDIITDIVYPNIEYIRQHYKDKNKQNWMINTIFNEEVTEITEQSIFQWFTNYYFDYKPLEIEDFVEVLLAGDLTLIDYGEQLAAVYKLLTKKHINFEVRHFSLKEVGDEAKFVLPKNYNVSEMNIIKSKIAAIRKRVHELIAEFGEGVTTLNDYTVLLDFMRDPY